MDPKHVLVTTSAVILQEAVHESDSYVGSLCWVEKSKIKIFSLGLFVVMFHPSKLEDRKEGEVLDDGQI